MKKIISILVVTVLSVFCMSTAAVASSAPVVIVAEEVTAANQLTLSYTLENNPGISGFGLTLEYDETAMTLKSLKKGELCTGGFFAGSAKKGEAEFAYAYDEEGNPASITEDGVLFTAVFDITNAKVGEYEFSLTGTFADDSFEHN